MGEIIQYLNKCLSDALSSYDSVATLKFIEKVSK